MGARDGDAGGPRAEAAKEIAASRERVLDRLAPDVRPFVSHRDAWWRPDEACSLYAAAHSMVSMEPHSVIMALAAGTPAVHLFSPVHGTKAWMFRDLDLSEWLVDIDAEPARTASDALRRIAADREMAKAKVRRTMALVHARSAEMMREIAASMG